jgi:D-beta-D-heptose 7-phosphate kinase/D-beta-D-heptose 1-phosphate adenosyltransferase
MSRALPALPTLTKCRVLVVGDLMLDEYCRGHIERISPEAPVPILSVVGREAVLGGAGNVLQNLRALGVQATIVSVIGEDKTGERIRGALRGLGVDVDGIVCDPGRKSTLKMRFVSVEHGQQVFRTDEESTHGVNGTIEEKVVDLIRERSAQAQVILCSDYLKGLLSERILQAVFQAGREFRRPVVVAPKDSSAGKYLGANILMPNARELARLTGTSMNGLEWLTDSAGRLTKSLSLDALLVTRGGEGMSLFEHTENGLRRVDIATVARNVYDVTGAGDTAIAAFAAALAAGADRESAAHLANVAAGIVVGKRGTAVATIEEIQDHLTEQELQRPRNTQPPLAFGTASSK